MDFRTLPTGGPFTLTNCVAPSEFSGADGDFVPVDLAIADGKIGDGTTGPEIDMGGSIVLPAFTDMHTHLDKGHIWRRASNPDGTFMGALTTVGADREANWSAEDVRARMDFALRCAYAHGTRAVRTHIDSLAPQDAISWPVFREVREEWKDRIELQASCLLTIEAVEPDSPFVETADRVVDSGGVLGTVTFPVPVLKERLEFFFRTAADRNLAVDFHVDETGDPAVRTLRSIAETAIEMKFDAPIVVGHCCSLAVQEEDYADRTMDLMAEAGIAVVSLPMCNMYLQSRERGRTPRWRGVTLVHEMKSRGIPVAFASDNTRDPFYAYGDLDMMEVLREATRIAQLDHSDPDWIRSFSATPCDVCGFSSQTLNPGDPADLVICNARDWTELFARPQSDRIVVRNGKPIDRTLPDYRELDHLMEDS
ncbi:cytosine deaminase [Hoeflea sp. CAU 1731]